ncbi:hypothetical protein [Alteribacter populi]|uniref:hypothetical protein n=1 Tax=Alteribacter populi TaxID=2011011 RepID=UPI000BBA9E96|nr:hypothetical protein [Alteribacter populi]
MWQFIQDRFLGFVPEKSTLFAAVTYLVICFVSLKISGKMTNAFSLPWQKEENQKVRKQIKKEGKAK